MKGQFFVMASVIMIFSLVLVIQYFYDFSNINLTELGSMNELYFIQYIKDSLNTTVMSSYSSTKNCEKLKNDINLTEIFLKNEMISRGINLTVENLIACPWPLSPPDVVVEFNFSLKTPNLYTITDFKSTA
jgi:hypothetical protein